MALRTFRSNPSLGGFGSESTINFSSQQEFGDCSDSSSPCASGDAFAQIIKELVDNAVDACSSNSQQDSSMVPASSTSGKHCQNNNNDEKFNSRPIPKRVQVKIERFEGNLIATNRSKSNKLGEDEKEINCTNDNGPANNGSTKVYEDRTTNREILKVTVTDNGCGIPDIEASVGAFHTSKGHAAASAAKETYNSSEDEEPPGNDNGRLPKQSSGNSNTAGRYGIGLTLCLLHSQRLVPNFAASIMSATESQTHYTKVKCIVDADSDSICCIQNEKLPKSFPSESGTTIAVLVPGGNTAKLAWHRLAEYFNRFKLSLDIQCSLEVLAPTLSKVPLYVRSASELAKLPKTKQKEGRDEPLKVGKSQAQKNTAWYDVMVSSDYDSGPGEEQEAAIVTEPKKKKNEPSCSQGDSFDRNQAICKASRHYLECPVEIENVAHAFVPIKMQNSDSSMSDTKQDHPKMEVDFIVYGSGDDPHWAQCDGVDSDVDDGGSSSICIEEEEKSCATITLVRMVNKIPLLDSSEVVACGLVQGLASKRNMWNSFGLDVSLDYDPAQATKLPTFQVRDSEQVKPFFRKGAHALFDPSAYNEKESVASSLDKEEEDDDDDDASDLSAVGQNKRKHSSICRRLLPAQLRLGNILIIVQIHANPTTLPLPTLSKGRLPADNVAIDTALELGLIDCLRQLQNSNPELLLTARELLKSQQLSLYVPSIADAMASIVFNSKNEKSKRTILHMVQRWKNDDNNMTEKGKEEESEEEEDGVDSVTSSVATPSSQDNNITITEVAHLIEKRFKYVLNEKKRSKRVNKKQSKRTIKEEEEKDDDSTFWDDELLNQESTSQNPVVSKNEFVRHSDASSTQEDETLQGQREFDIFQLDDWTELSPMV